jgi:hypothetical protein
VLVLSILRVTVIRLDETPKYLLSKGEDAKAVEIFQRIATRYKRPCSLTLEQMNDCGQTKSTFGEQRYGFSEFKAHLKGLFATKKLGISTGLIWVRELTQTNGCSLHLLIFLTALVDADRSRIPAVLRLPSRIPGLPWRKDGRRQSILHVEKLPDYQHRGYLWSSGGWLYVQYQTAWSEVYHGHWRSGLFS